MRRLNSVVASKRTPKVTYDSEPRQAEQEESPERVNQNYRRTPRLLLAFVSSKCEAKRSLRRPSAIRRHLVENTPRSETKFGSVPRGIDFDRISEWMIRSDFRSPLLD